MSFFQRSFVLRSSALVALTLGCTAPVIGCGGDDDDVPADDSGTDGDLDAVSEGGTDSGRDSGTDTKTDSLAEGGVDSGIDSGIDSGKTDSGPDAPDTRPDSAADVADTADTALVDSGIDSVVVDTSCGAAGSACAGGKICLATGVCGDCATDTECSTATSGTLCFAGTCLAAACHPKKDATCAGTDAVNCCAVGTSAGTCVSAASGKTTCCADADCASLPGTTTCDTASNTCVCPAPAPGQLFVATTGNDTTGNGSASCPFVTIAKAVGTLSATPPAVASTITLGDGVYGTGCTAGAGCDVTPITVPAAIASGITIKGSGASASVVGSASASWVFVVNAPATSMSALTIVPTHVATTAPTTRGGGGILYSATAATTEGTISAVTITGIGGANPTREGIMIRGGASPTLGPAFVTTGGEHGIVVSDSATGVSNVKIKSATGAQTSISGSSTACIRVETTGAGGAPSIATSSSDAATPIHLRDCNRVGGVGGLVVDTAAGGATNNIGDLLVDKSATGAGFIGLRFRNNANVVVTGSSVTDVGGTGILAEDSATMSLILVSSLRNSRGVYITGSAKANIAGLTASSNVSLSAGEGDGLKCDSTGLFPGLGVTVKLRGSILLSNSGKGAWFTFAAGGGTTGCVADLGNATEAGGNIFNRSTSKNTGTGLCYTSTGLSTAGTVATPTLSTWACTASTTPTSQPAPFVNQCTNGFDFGYRTAPPGAVVGSFGMTPGQTCL